MKCSGCGSRMEQGTICTPQGMWQAAGSGLTDQTSLFSGLREGRRQAWRCDPCNLLVVQRDPEDGDMTAKQKAQLAASRCESRIHLYQSRLSQLCGIGSSEVARDLEFESAFKTAIVEAIRNPSVRVDSIGAIFISPHNPFNELRQNEFDV